MKLLLDTSAFIQASYDPKKLSARAIELLLDPVNDLYVSALAAWEIAAKQAVGKLDSKIHPREAARMMHYSWLPIDESVYDIQRDLPLHHKDPFDRLLIAQAISGGLTILASDKQFERYAVSVVW
jgi:PIN domain nuclease of toxin-antitoxin system